MASAAASASPCRCARAASSRSASATAACRAATTTSDTSSGSGSGSGSDSGSGRAPGRGEWGRLSSSVDTVALGLRSIAETPRSAQTSCGSVRPALPRPLPSLRPNPALG